LGLLYVLHVFAEAAAKAEGVTSDRN